MVGISGSSRRVGDYRSVGGTHVEDLGLRVGHGLDIQLETLLTLRFMKYIAEIRNCIAKSGRNLDCSSQKVFNLSPWKSFGQIGSSISARCTGVTTAASGRVPRWSAPRGELSAAAISARSVAGRSEIRVTDGSTLSPKLWVYPLEPGWRMKTKALRVSAS